MPTKIEWCDETINPVVGCSKNSEGCLHCYAEIMARRLKGMGHQKYQSVVDKNGWTGKIGIDLNVFSNVTQKPKKIFVASMGDLFHKNVPLNVQQDIFSNMHSCQRHIFILLTKRPENINTKKIQSGVYHSLWAPNIWLGVTAENQKRADERIPVLLEIPAAVRFVSVEPMLESVNVFNGRYIDINNPQFVDWVIAGPETGSGKRECKTEWIKDLYEQCQDAEIPFFDKTKKNWLAREFPESKTT